MRFLSLIIVVTALTACSSPWGSEKPVPAGETRQRHLADRLLESIFAAEFRHVVVGPANRRNRQFDVLLVHFQLPDTERQR